MIVIVLCCAMPSSPPSIIKNKNRKQVIWDEENILYNESQRHLYGQMKIDEPKTPYEHEVEGAGP